MTVTAAMIAQVSPYTVSDKDSLLNNTLFTYLSSVAKALLDTDDPGFSTTIYDHCHALLIAHLYAVKKGDTGYQSQSAHGYSVSRKPGETAYLVEYKKILSMYAGAHSSDTDDSEEYEGVLRADAVMADFQLDQAEMPIFFTADDV